jgi:hypothetical protein
MALSSSLIDFFGQIIRVTYGIESCSLKSLAKTRTTQSGPLSIFLGQFWLRSLEITGATYFDQTDDTLH